MFRNLSIAAGVAALSLIGSAAAAQVQPDRRFYLHVGPAQLDLDESAVMTAGGQPVPGGDISIEPQITAVFELGYFIRPNVAVSFTGGVPPKAEIEAAGSLEGLGKLGEITYGPAAVTAHYHFNPEGRLRPYAGGGVSFMYVFDEEDGLLTDLNVENTIGLAVQAGAEYMFTDRLGAFVDYKKAFFSSESTGNLGGAPIQADVQLDPAVVHAGLSFRF